MIYIANLWNYYTSLLLFVVVLFIITPVLIYGIITSICIIMVWSLWSCYRLTVIFYFIAGKRQFSLLAWNCYIPVYIWKKFMFSGRTWVAQYTYLYAYIYMYMHTYILMTYTHRYVHTVHMYIHTYMHTYVCTYIHIYIHMQITYLYACIHITCMYINTWIHTRSACILFPIL